MAQYLLLNQEDAVYFQKRLEDRKQVHETRLNFWIETTHHVSFRGKRSEQLPRNYYKIFSQLHLYNGDIAALTKQKRYGWIKARTSSKLKFLTTHIKPCHPEKADTLGALKERIRKQKQKARRKKKLGH